MGEPLVERRFRGLEPRLDPDQLTFGLEQPVAIAIALLEPRTQEKQHGESAEKGAGDQCERDRHGADQGRAGPGRCEGEAAYDSCAPGWRKRSDAAALK